MFQLTIDPFTYPVSKRKAASLIFTATGKLASKEGPSIADLTAVDLVAPATLDEPTITEAQFSYKNNKPTLSNGVWSFAWTVGDRTIPTDEERRAAMPPISPLQGILTLGEAEWDKVLTYRDGATWAEKVVIDNAADWVRTSQNIAFFGHLLSYTEAQMDDLFTQAALVTA